MTKKHQKCQTSPILLETILGSSPLLWWYFILAIVTQFTNWIIILAHKPRRKILFYPFAENRNLVTLHDDVSFGNKYACPIFQELKVFLRERQKKWYIIKALIESFCILEHFRRTLFVKCQCHLQPFNQFVVCFILSVLCFVLFVVCFVLSVVCWYILSKKILHPNLLSFFRCCL